ncbi:MAG: DUF4386 domain-containing protein [Gammaproteobacteria bacterium]
MASAVRAERLYRVGLVLQAITPVCTIVLAYALFAVTRAVDRHLAAMALLFRLGETYIGSVAIMPSFGQLDIYKAMHAGAPQAAAHWDALLALSRSARFVGFNTSTLFFSCGSILFFILLHRDRLIPSVQTVFGLFASALVTLVSLANMIFPEHGAVFQFGWAPIFLSEIVTGTWLLVRGVRLGPASGTPRQAR